MKFFIDGGSFFNKYLQTKHKKWIFSAKVHLIRKEFIFSGIYLKADHFEMLRVGGSKKLWMLNLFIDWGWGLFFSSIYKSNIKSRFSSQMFVKKEHS